VKAGYWDKKENVLEFLEWAADKLGITKKEQWLNVTRKHIIELGGNTLLDKYGGVQKLVTTFYPEYNWEDVGISVPFAQSKSQLLLFNGLKGLFPTENILIGVKLKPKKK